MWSWTQLSNWACMHCAKTQGICSVSLIVFPRHYSSNICVQLCVFLFFKEKITVCVCVCVCVCRGGNKDKTRFKLHEHDNVLCLNETWCVEENHAGWCIHFWVAVTPHLASPKSLMDNLDSSDICFLRGHLKGSLKTNLTEFLGGPVGRIPDFHSWRLGFDLWLWN